MSREITAICWAAAILLLAGAVATGVVASEDAKTFFIVLPAIAWLSISQQRCCPLSKGDAA